MNTLHNQYDPIENLIFEQGWKMVNVEITPLKDKLLIFLNNGRIFSIPIQLFKRLATAKTEEIEKFELTAGGTGIYWPLLDEDLSLKGFLRDFLRLSITDNQHLIVA